MDRWANWKNPANVLVKHGGCYNAYRSTLQCFATCVRGSRFCQRSRSGAAEGAARRRLQLDQLLWRRLPGRSSVRRRHDRHRSRQFAQFRSYSGGLVAGRAENQHSWNAGSDSSFIGGGTVGCNWQPVGSPWVLGIEGEAGYMKLEGAAC